MNDKQAENSFAAFLERLLVDTAAFIAALSGIIGLLMLKLTPIAQDGGASPLKQTILAIIMWSEEAIASPIREWFYNKLEALSASYGWSFEFIPDWVWYWFPHYLPVAISFFIGLVLAVLRIYKINPIRGLLLVLRSLPEFLFEFVKNPLLAIIVITIFLALFSLVFLFSPIGVLVPVLAWLCVVSLSLIIGLFYLMMFVALMLYAVISLYIGVCFHLLAWWSSGGYGFFSWLIRVPLKTILYLCSDINLKSSLIKGLLVFLARFVFVIILVYLSIVSLFFLMGVLYMFISDFKSNFIAVKEDPSILISIAFIVLIMKFSWGEFRNKCRESYLKDFPDEQENYHGYLVKYFPRFMINGFEVLILDGAKKSVDRVYKEISNFNFTKLVHFYVLIRRQYLFTTSLIMIALVVDLLLLNPAW